MGWFNRKGNEKNVTNISKDVEEAEYQKAYVKAKVGAVERAGRERGLTEAKEGKYYKLKRSLKRVGVGASRFINIASPPKGRHESRKKGFMTGSRLYSQKSDEPFNPFKGSDLWGGSNTKTKQRKDWWES